MPDDRPRFRLPAPTLRRRLSTVVLVGGLAWTLSGALGATPSDVRLRYRLGPRHADVRELSVRYEHEGDPVAAVAFREPGGAPATVRHEVRLPAGETRVVATLRGADGALERLERTVEVPAEGEVQVDLFRRSPPGSGR